MINDADKLIPTRQSPPYSIRIILLARKRGTR